MNSKQRFVKVRVPAMPHTTSRRDSFERIECVDALRGFALAGMGLTHFVRQFNGIEPSAEARAAMFAGPVDAYVDAFVSYALIGKFFGLFSLLFGLSFFIQMDRAVTRGMAYKTRFLWRLAILFGIGIVNSLFYSGDILTIYALIGVALVPFHGWSNKAVLAAAAILFLGTARFLVFWFFGSDPLYLISDAAQENYEYFETLKSGSLIDVWAVNALRVIHRFNFQFGVDGRAYLTFAFFLLGMWIGRTRLLECLQASAQTLKKTATGSLLGAFALLPMLLYLRSRMAPTFEFTTWLSMFALTVYDFVNLLLTVFLAAGFVFLFQQQFMQRMLKCFAPYGRMALTNYVAQVVIGTWILFHWGLGYLGKLRNIESFAIATVVITVGMIVSRFWLAKFRFGPLEWLWRSLTYLKREPFVR